MLADRGDRDDLHREVEIPHHPADEGELLRVLLPEEGRIGCRQVEQLGDDGEHPVEVLGPEGALQHVAHRPRGDPHLRLAARVDLGRGRGEDHVRAFLPGDLQIGLQGARVALQVLTGAELERVDEDRHHDLTQRTHPVPGRAHQRGVALVQRTHGHDDGPVARARQGAQFGSRTDDARRHAPASPSRPSPRSAPPSSPRPSRSPRPSSGSSPGVRGAPPAGPAPPDEPSSGGVAGRARRRQHVQQRLGGPGPQQTVRQGPVGGRAGHRQISGHRPRCAATQLLDVRRDGARVTAGHRAGQRGVTGAQRALSRAAPSSGPSILSGACTPVARSRSID